jgi:hypothetical protein
MSSFTRTARRACRAATLGLSVVALTACDDILAVDLPSQLTDDAFENPTGAQVQINTIIGQFEKGYNDHVYVTFGREAGGEVFLSAGYPTNSGYFTYGITHPSYADFAKSLRFATFLHDKLEKEWTVAEVPQRAQFLAISSIYGGAVLGWMGASLCEATVNAGPLMTSDQTLTLAETWLTRALTEIAAAGGDFEMPFGISPSAKTMATGLRAQVRWMKGDLTGAATDAAAVPQGFRAYVVREPTDNNRRNLVFYATTNRPHYQQMYGVIDWWGKAGAPNNPVTGQPWPNPLPFTGWGDLAILPNGRAVREDGLPIRTKGPYTTTEEQTTAVLDSRAKSFVDIIQGKGNNTGFVNNRYASEAEDYPLVNWKEMVLIRAEAAGGQGAIDLVNTLRAADNLPRVTYADPGNAQQIRYMLIEERRRALYTEARYFYTMLKNPDVAWFPRAFGQTWQAGMNLQGGVRWLMPQGEYELNPNLSLTDQATGCKPAERPVNF